MALKDVNVGDVRLHTVDSGDGPVVLLVHGFPLDHTMWRGQIEDLSRSARVLAPDLRGFGRSGAAADTVTMEQFADDLSGLLDALEITEPVAFCGLSMGGYIAWQFWRRHADRLDRLILCDTRAAADTPEAAADRLRAAEVILADGPQVLAKAMLPKLLAPAGREQRPELFERLETMIVSTPRGTIAAALRGMARRRDMTDVLGRVNVPTLLMCGEHDAITPPAEMRRVAEALPEAEYVEIAGAAHMTPMENPAAVSAAIRKFLRLEK